MTPRDTRRFARGLPAPFEVFESGSSKDGSRVGARGKGRGGFGEDIAQLGPPMGPDHDRLARFKCPTSVDEVDGLPHTATGKVVKAFRFTSPPLCGWMKESPAIRALKPRWAA